VSEQLAGIRRILSDVIAPEVTGAYPVDMLRGVLANLEMLERSWSKVPEFLDWDNVGTAYVLGEATPYVDDDLRARIVASARDIGNVDGDHGDLVSIETLAQRNEVLRGLLAEVVPVLAAGGDETAEAYAELRAHLRERMDRFPFSMNAPMPGSAAR
jgi:hypothetical protein